MNPYNIQVKRCIGHACVGTRHGFTGRGQGPLQHVSPAILLISHSCATPPPPLWDTKRCPDTKQWGKRGKHALVCQPFSLVFASRHQEQHLVHLQGAMERLCFATPQGRPSMLIAMLRSLPLSLWSNPCPSVRLLGAAKHLQHACCFAAQFPL